MLDLTQPIMQISYYLSKKDIWNFQWYGVFHNKSLRILYFILTLFIFLLALYPFGVWLNYCSSSGECQSITLLNIFLFSLVEFLILLISTITISLILMTITLLIQTANYKEGDGTLGSHQIVAEENFLIERTDLNETYHSWKNVQKIAITKNYIFIYVSPTNAHVIPKKHFQNETLAENFIEEVKRLKQQSETGFSPSYLV